MYWKLYDFSQAIWLSANCCVIISSRMTASQTWSTRPTSSFLTREDLASDPFFVLGNKVDLSVSFKLFYNKYFDKPFTLFINFAGLNLCPTSQMIVDNFVTLSKNRKKYWRLGLSIHSIVWGAGFCHIQTVLLKFFR